MHILLVDDEAIVRETLDAFIRHLGHTSEWAGDGVAAQEILMKNCYGGAFVDIRMPAMDGLSLLKWCRNDLPQLPVVIMSGHGGEDSCNTALRYGAFAFLKKPFSLEEIRQLLKKIELWRKK